MRTISSIELFNLVAQKKINEDTDWWLQYHMEIRHRMKDVKSEIVNSVKPIYKGRRLQHFIIDTYPGGHIFKVVREMA